MLRGARFWASLPLPRAFEAMVLYNMLIGFVLRGARFGATLPLPRALQSLVLGVCVLIVSTPVVLVQFLLDLVGFA